MTERVGRVRLDAIDFHQHNVREDLGDLRDLTASIRRFGIMQPVVLEQRGDRLRIRAGHRRVAAARLAMRWEAVADALGISQSAAQAAIRPKDASTPHRRIHRVACTRLAQLCDTARVKVAAREWTADDVLAELEALAHPEGDHSPE